MIRDLAALLGPRLRPSLRSTLGWLVVAGVLQGAAVSLLLPVLRALLSGDRDGALRWLGVLVVAVVLAAVAHHRASMRGFDLALATLSETSLRFGDRLTILPAGWLRSRSPGLLARVGTSSLQTTMGSIAHLVQPLVYGVTTPAVIGVVLLVADWRLGVVVAAMVPVLWACFRFAARALGRSEEHAHAAAARTSQAVLEFAHCQAVLRAFGRTGDGGYQPLEDAVEAQQVAGRRLLWVTVPGMLVTGLALQVGFTAVVLVGLALVDADAVDAVSLVALLALLARFLGPLALVSELSGGLRMAGNDIRRLREVLDAVPLPEPVTSAPLTAPGTVELAGVTFGYGSAPVVRDVDLVVPATGVTALVGPSGAGKSTLTRLVTRAWDTDEGVVRVGGVDVREQRREDLLAQLAVVSQDVHLFDDTLRGNVLLGRPEATDEELGHAARLAGLDALVERLPGGWASRVGESGARLSGGERQRVSIARALLKRAPIVVLDEVTAALDPANEHLIRRSVAEMATSSTVLVVAHTPAMISLADQVVVLDRGRVVQTGTVDELLDMPGPFARLWGERRTAAAWTLSRGVPPRS